MHAATTGTRDAVFPARLPVDPRETARLRTLPRPRADRFRCAPGPAAEATCAALGEAPSFDDALRDWGPGRWAGRSLDAVAAEDPDGVASWLADPAATPHGGESLLALLERVRGLLDGAEAGHTVAVCGPAVARAAVVVAMGAPPAAFWRVDAAPLTVTDLRGGPARWTVRATGSALVGGRT